MPYADPEVKRKYYQSSHHKENVARWQREHPERRKEILQKYMDNGGCERRNQSRLNGKTLPDGEIKRSFLGYCEVCGRSLVDRQKDYHHWDDSMPAMGIWLCINCHAMAECIDNNLYDKYIECKVRIEKEYAQGWLKRIGLSDNWGQ